MEAEQLIRLYALISDALFCGAALFGGICLLTAIARPPVRMHRLAGNRDRQTGRNGNASGRSGRNGSGRGNFWTHRTPRPGSRQICSAAKMKKPKPGSMNSWRSRSG